VGVFVKKLFLLVVMSATMSVMAFAATKPVVKPALPAMQASAAARAYEHATVRRALAPQTSATAMIRRNATVKPALGKH
jgi:hypothetical protein